MRFVAGAVLTAVLLISLVVPVGSSDTRLDNFAKCIADKRATMYGSFYCIHCDDQKKLFGSSFQYVPYVECSVPGSREMTYSCRVAQIHRTPTWIFASGERIEGTQTLQNLSEKTGCPLR